MIFILLGILILIAAFVIALVSLIREQKNSSVFTHSHGKTDEPEEKTLEEKEISEPKVLPVKEIETSKQEEREPFPWEVTESANNEINTEPLAREQGEPEPKFEFQQTVEPKREETMEDDVSNVQSQTSYNPSLPAGGVVEISMKDMIDRAKNTEGSQKSE